MLDCSFGLLAQIIDFNIIMHAQLGFQHNTAVKSHVGAIDRD